MQALNNKLMHDNKNINISTSNFSIYHTALNRNNFSSKF